MSEKVPIKDSKGKMWDLLHQIDNKITRIETKMDIVEKSYVTKSEFAPVQRIVYGLVGIILISFLGGILTLVISKGV